MPNGKKINVGSKERPIFVPEKALKPGTPEGAEWWEMVANGSVVLPPEALDKLLSKDNDGKKS